VSGAQISQKNPACWLRSRLPWLRCARERGAELALLAMLLWTPGFAHAGASGNAAGNPASPVAQAQAAPASRAERSKEMEQRKLDEPEAEDGENVYRHSPMVHTLAHLFGLSTEITARIFEGINFVILMAAVLWFALRKLPTTLRNRAERIQRELAEARSASEEARRRLDAVEQRLSRLDQEIAAIQAQAERETVAEEQRLQAVLEEEKRKIVEAASREVAAIGANAQRQLKVLAAELVIEHARRQISVSVETDRALVSEFVATLAQSKNGGGVN
jgi:F-type H+-transporting ATPase subunit b